MIRVAAAEAYRIWAPEYDATPNPLLAVEQRMLADAVRGLARGLLLDVGCGTGRWARLARAARYAGVDLCREMIARRDCAVGSAAALPVRDSVAQVTLCSFVLGYVAEVEPVFAEFARVTAPGGSVVVSDLHPGSGWSRTFRRDGATYAIDHTPHPVGRVRAAAAAAGLRLASEHETAFAETERHLFVQAGREDLFARAAGVPAVWAAIWMRP